MMLGAMHAGVPYVSVSQAYSLMSADHAKLKAIIGQYDGLAIRASTKVTKEILAAAKNIQATARLPS